MKEDIVSLEIAKLAKEKGFESESSSYYYYIEWANTYGLETTQTYNQLDAKFEWLWGLSDIMPSSIQTTILEIFFTNKKRIDDKIEAPTQALLFKWLKDNHKLFVGVHYNYYKKFWTGDVFDLSVGYNSDKRVITHLGKKVEENSYELAMEKLLFKALKLVKNV
jgi:hypothetical protein